MFIILEVQANNDGTAGTLVYTYTDAQKDAAESKYHLVLSAAAVSNTWKHSAIMITETGLLLRSECYAHEVPPEPEPEVEPEEE